MEDRIEPSPHKYTSSYAQVLQSLGDVMNSKNSPLIALLLIIVGMGYMFLYGIDKITNSLEEVNTSLHTLTVELVKQNERASKP